MVTMYDRPRQTDERQTDRQTDGWTDEYHGNSATIRSTNASRAINVKRPHCRESQFAMSVVRDLWMKR